MVEKYGACHVAFVTGRGKEGESDTWWCSARASGDVWQRKRKREEMKIEEKF